MAKIILKKNEERRLKAGHLWVFSNEIENAEGVSRNGEVSELYSYSGNFLGKGFYNRNSLIAYRHLTDKDEEIGKEFLLKRINTANALRKLNKNAAGNIYRMVNSESDFLPGLIIDRFEDKFSFQIFSLGMEYFRNEIMEILKDNFSAGLIVEKNDNELRILEGLEKKEGILYNNTGNDSTEFVISVDEIKYKVNLLKGQKTGFYLDQAGTRYLIRKYIQERHRVLDLFCNEGGFALNCALAGAKEITAIDSSEHAIETAKENMVLNNFNGINFICSDVFDYLNSLFQTKEKFDVIILDPPSFTKSKKNLIPALKGYEELNVKAMRLLKSNSLLFTFSCSHHISENNFENVLANSSAVSGRKIQLLEKITSSYDHPVLIQMAETKYLKGYLLRIL